ncbi:hypothetical protein EDB89DRAFT_699395 [Lactarius sanguifluus]|nr:hypothetical protein EDB89DRAFT_699395 [Lactarius sanguifluus]
MIASKDLSLMRLEHAEANTGPAAADGQPKPRMRHLCKNMQKAVQGTASRLLAFIGIGRPSLAVTAPVPNLKGGIMRIQITTNSPARRTSSPRSLLMPRARSKESNLGMLRAQVEKGIKVAQLVGYISEHAAYHHGKQSLTMTIVDFA